MDEMKSWIAEAVAAHRANQDAKREALRDKLRGRYEAAKKALPKLKQAVADALDYIHGVQDVATKTGAPLPQDVQRLMREIERLASVPYEVDRGIKAYDTLDGSEGDAVVNGIWQLLGEHDGARSSVESFKGQIDTYVQRMRENGWPTRKSLSEPIPPAPVLPRDPGIEVVSMRGTKTFEV